MMKNIRRILILFALALLWIPCAYSQDGFSVENERVTGKTKTSDGFEIILDFPIPKNEFFEPVPQMTAKKYDVDSENLRNVWDTYASLDSKSELPEPQVFIDMDSQVGTQYVYSGKTTEMAFQIVGINPPYRRQDECINDIDQEAIVRCILSDLNIDVEYPLYYIAKGSVDYANVKEEEKFIRNEDTLFIARQMIEDYPLATSHRFKHGKSIYSGGFIAIVLDERNHLAYLNLYNIVHISPNKKRAIPCITWQVALESFFNQKKDFSFETFDERRVSLIEPDCMSVRSISPALLYDDKSGKITPIWEIESQLEFCQILPDGTRRNISRMRQYHVNAWTGEYLCYDP